MSPWNPLIALAPADSRNGDCIATKAAKRGINASGDEPEHFLFVILSQFIKREPK
jgi:hypothetical protein